MRKLYQDADGVVRFKGNAVVRFLLDEAREGRPCDLNRLWVEHANGRFTRAAMRDFYQLIGYSVSGYGDIFYKTRRDRAVVTRADARVEKLRAKETPGAPK